MWIIWYDQTIWKRYQMQILGGPLMATPYKNSGHFYGTSTYDEYSDQTLTCAASDKGIHCLLTEFLLKVRKMKNNPTSLNLEMA